MKSLIVILLLCSISISINAQYLKLPLDTNHYWQENTRSWGSYPTDFSNCSYVLKFRKDSIISGKVYKWIVSSNESCTPPNYSVYESGLIREDTVRKMVIIRKGSVEQILFNFNKNAGDTALMLAPSGMMTYKLSVKDSVLLNDGIYHRRSLFTPSPEIVLIEGVGSIGGLLRTWHRDFEVSYSLLCLGQINPASSIYNNLGLGESCPNTTGIFTHSRKVDGLSIFPSPSTDFIRINNESLTIKSVKITSALGQDMLNLSNINSNSTDINISDLPTGLYFITVNYGASYVTRQLIKN